MFFFKEKKCFLEWTQTEKKNKDLEREPNFSNKPRCRLSACSPRVRVRNQLEAFVFQSNITSLLPPHHTAVGYRYYPG
jgi:hypothetical protein